MISEVSGGVFDHPYSDVSELPGSPACCAALAPMFCRFDLCPVRDFEGEPPYLHGDLLLVQRMVVCVGGGLTQSTHSTLRRPGTTDFHLAWVDPPGESQPQPGG